MEKIPFFQKEDRYPYTPHVRVGFLVYSRFWDWGFRARVTHLFWRFWWIRFNWYLVGYWIGSALRFGMIYARI